MPVRSKVLDTLLLKRAESWIDSQLDRRGISCIETAATLQEAISQCRKRGQTVYVALLDVKKGVRHSLALRDVPETIRYGDGPQTMAHPVQQL